MPVIAPQTPRASPPAALAAVFACGLLVAARATAAESFRYAGTEFNAMRPIAILPGKSYSVVVTEFFHHGEINKEGTNVLVAARNRDLCPVKILQLGPGDYCRLAFQPIERQSAYEVVYGGDPPRDRPPAFDSREGLLLETRRYKHCNLNRFEAVREAFASAEPFGADYVDNVSHSANPFSLAPEPFFSHYSGYLHIDTPGAYGFMTTSQDASFVLVDDKLVVEAPGRHPPVHRAFRGSRKDVQLSAGAHKFDYYHAATGPEAIMAVAWEINPKDAKPQPAKIPDEVFHSQQVGHIPAGLATTRVAANVPDFLVKIAGDVPLPDNPEPLVGVGFRNVTPPALTLQAKIQWDFGDGQTSDLPNPDHIYLRPGVYPVTLSIKRSTRATQMTNRIGIDRPFLTPKDKTHTLDEYLRILDAYNPRTLDAASLRQLALAYEAKALQLESEADDLRAKAAADAEARQSDPNRAAPEKPQQAVEGEEAIKQKESEARAFLAKAVAAGATAFGEGSSARGDDDLWKLAQLVAPMARRLGDSATAAKVWYGAAQKIAAPALKGQCETESADIAVNDLLNKAAAKTLLDSAAAHLGATPAGEAAARLQRVWGDYYAWTGSGEAARKAYREAERLLGAKQRFNDATAWRGAHSRSTEEFIQRRQFDRAILQIQQWLADFPTARLEGYLTLLYAKYWDARGSYAQAIAQSEQLAEANPDSPYVDQLLLLAARCETRRNRNDAAVAILHSILQDYPGSPLVPEVKKLLTSLESGARQPGVKQ